VTFLRSLRRTILGARDREEIRPRYLVVGLGNPGPRYSGNRHNAGFQALDVVARKHNLGFSRGRSRAILAEGHIDGTPVVLAKPLTYMNRSGQAVARLAHRYGLPPDRVLVIYDDMDLPIGRVRLRPRGGAGGHRGVGSIVEALGTQDFPRLRLGIGRPQGEDSVDHVLSDFDAAEADVIEGAYREAVEVIRDLLDRGVEAAMNLHNSGDAT
jgi:PTH1 family peptidyl-tRNA hydrolase